MNNKILMVVLVAGIATTGFAGLSSANEFGFLKGNGEIRELVEKAKAGETLSEAEQTMLDEAKANRGKHNFGKRKGGKNLTDEERSELEAMSDDEKKAFFTVKKAEMKVKKQSHKAVIAKLIAGETLSTDEETIRAEIAERLSGDKASKREGTEVIKKLVNGEALSSEDQASLAEMQAKRAERGGHEKGSRGER